MSELDTYFQPTGRKFGEAGSLQPGTMSLMGRLDAVMGMQNDQRRRMELARRVQRQLGQQSRRGNVRAGLLALDFMDREAAAGQPIPAGISSYESNRARGAQTIMDNEDQAAQMDEVTRGGSMSQTGTEPGYQPGINADANREWAAGVRAEQEKYPSLERPPVSNGSLAQRVASAPAAPSSSPMMASPSAPAGQMDSSGSRDRAGVVGSGSGGMLTDSDKELLDAGRRVAGLRPAGFGSRPGGQFGIQVSSVASPAPSQMTPTPSPAVPPAAPSPVGPVKIDESTLPKETLAKVAAMRDRNARFEDVRGFRQSMADGKYKAGIGRLAQEREALDREALQRKNARFNENVAYETEKIKLEEKRLADLAEGERKLADSKSRRITKRSDVNEADGSVFAGNAYRPVNWTQEDEDAAARDMRLADRLAPLSMFGFGKLAVNRANRATGRALDPSKWNR